MRHAFLLGLLAVGLVVAAGSVGGCEREHKWSPPKTEPQEAQPPLPTATISVGDAELIVEVADTDHERTMGYMFRDKPADGHGMLFVFPKEERRAFYMKNTSFDLDLAYISADGTISQVVRMKAYRLANVPSLHPAKYVLEVPAGWFVAHKVDAGSKAVIPPEIKAQDETGDKTEE